MMARCVCLKRDGGQCATIVKPSQIHCYQHDPANAERRSRSASRAARSKGNREVATLKEEIKSLIMDVKVGELDRNDAAVMIQGYRVLKDLIALERKVKETDELAAEIEELKREYGVA